MFSTLNVLAFICFSAGNPFFYKKKFCPAPPDVERGVCLNPNSCKIFKNWFVNA